MTLYGQFEGDERGVRDKTVSRIRLRRGDLKYATESLIIAAQGQTLDINAIKYHIDKTSITPKLRRYGEH